ncbi:MAG: 2,3,4,5-tetrahydropyridine-2,6-dicarboxylate N-succinyltransferase [Acidiphilium sp. 37-64-53]|uniref:2,3,4,5-tetrahydropyridine-2,6-dicarboxylate N-succinyltransferase n=1 Tax=Acidiphilium TaxID=522 RepID=UPI000BD717C0|nr:MULTISPECIES: 2,3,4,5-tetrahydropyridine-2,6-dicarboxylate N-succinyltransferase [Acidiphilium]OYW04063.1 MAG: 2,3,4,5-tetrahydropyridine-2,6-dicarboxylate N-succinyltransferase [Acidiphilium sp. 37-64-53]OZB29013.1 MAG: 2,3,4,5-tetrahydropyridine-2,6-dicarboxylate N-succinyltransferase [Acidiphilium sp. 34-64-41]HQT83297.1 2,3,4,5-tetrahydropyridine-2,6-dicarboxylate N-succinyltransferase [Acidiphilium rubrum]
MDQASLQSAIEMLWQNRDKLVSGQRGGEQAAIVETLDLLDRGVLRVAEFENGNWTVHQWVKQAILLSFRIMPNAPMPGAGGAPVFDKVAMKFTDWDTNRFADAGIRAVPGAVVRHSAHISRGAVLMPCFINVGARVGEDTMIDTWSTVGSCAQVGRNCHISGGVGIGGVLEPLQANPVIIEDDCFIGARSEVAEGVIVERGAVLSMGVFLGASTRIVDRATGDVSYGRVPAYSVVVPGSMSGKPLPDGSQGPSLACAVIVKRVDAQTRSKTAINELLRA